MFLKSKRAKTGTLSKQRMILFLLNGVFDFIIVFLEVEVQEEPSTTKITSSDKGTSTIGPGPGTESGTCHVGFTSICGFDKTNGCPPDMYKFFPNNIKNDKENELSTVGNSQKINSYLS